MHEEVGEKAKEITALLLMCHLVIGLDCKGQGLWDRAMNNSFLGTGIW